MTAFRSFPFPPAGLLAIFLVACGSAPPKPAEGTVADSTAVTAPAAAPLPENGHARITDNVGRVRMEGDMKDGQRNGVWTSYDDKGKVKSRNEYRNGRLNGITTVYRDNGALFYTGQYRNDKEIGPWKFFDDKGDLNKVVEYDSTGTPIGDTR